MFRRLAPAIVMLAALAPAMARAQTNIDQGKTPAQIWAGACAACHKSARGLANGRNSLTLTSFLHEHYTASRDQATAMAAYVLGAGAGETGAQARGQKPDPEHARTPAEEKKGVTRQARRPVKPEEETPPVAKPPPAPAEEARPEGVPSIVAEPGPASPPKPPGRREPGSMTATRGRPRQIETPVREPATVVATPAVPETPSPESNPAPGPASTAVAPTDTAPSDTEPVPPRDNIPD